MALSGTGTLSNRRDGAEGDAMVEVSVKVVTSFAG